jgi:hypothetical protein
MQLLVMANIAGEGNAQQVAAGSNDHGPEDARERPVARFETYDIAEGVPIGEERKAAKFVASVTEVARPQLLETTLQAVFCEISLEDVVRALAPNRQVVRGEPSDSATRTRYPRTSTPWSVSVRQCHQSAAR